MTRPVPSSMPDVFASIPKKLAEKNLALEFVDMTDLLPEQWRIEETRERACCNVQKVGKKKLLTDVLLWLEGYSTMVAVLATGYPEKAAHFMAYQQTIIHASKNFTGTAWASYDLCFRRKAANLRSLDWGVVDQDLYSKSFTGRAQILIRCKYCLSDVHVSEDCVEAPAPMEASWRKRVNATPKEICNLFNKPSGNVCRYSPCRFAHICSKCQKGDHPATECTRPSRDRSPLGRRENRRPRN